MTDKLTIRIIKKMLKSALNSNLDTQGLVLNLQHAVQNGEKTDSWYANKCDHYQKLLRTQATELEGMLKELRRRSVGFAFTSSDKSHVPDASRDVRQEYQLEMNLTT